MSKERSNILIGQTPIIRKTQSTSGSFVQLFGETYYCIAHYDQMPPFFMSLVSSADHWLFISSTGGLTAGRINADSALFPYETEDKISAHSGLTGSKTIMHVSRSGRWYLWEPFSNRYTGIYRTERHLYKNIIGDKLVFEEKNLDLQLSMRRMWRTSDRFGFIQSSWLHNDGAAACEVELIDGLQNIMPYGATSALQTSFSSLLHAYKRSELEPRTGMGVYALSATLTDRAEPSESLMASVAWQHGLQPELYLLCSDQLDEFCHGFQLKQEEDLKGKPGSYFVNAAFSLLAGQNRHWHIIADVNQDSASVVRLRQFLEQDAASIDREIEADVASSSDELVRYVAAADGLQLSAQETTTAHHFANTLFSIMRGGIFAAGYQVTRADLQDSIRSATGQYSRPRQLGLLICRPP